MTEWQPVKYTIKKNTRINDALEYFNRGKLNRSINPKTSGQLEELLVMLSEKGEEETFKYIRENLKRMKH